MKKVLKIFGGIIGILYLIVVIILTVLLLCYNDYKVSVVGGNSLIIIDDNSDKYKSGDLVVFPKTSNDEVSVGDEIFFYEVTNGLASINVGSVTNVEKISDSQSTYTINDNHDISSDSLIGKTSTAKCYSGLGSILSIFESKYGFLLLVILPTLVLFLYEVYRVIIEVKTPIEE